MADAIAEHAALWALPPSEWSAYLGAHSGLPGPRANLPLATAVALRANPAVVGELLRDGREFQTMCAAAALGARADDPASERRARDLASDTRWRVREGVALGLQLLGDTAPSQLARIVRGWADGDDPLVQRAATAAICEPRLLRTPETAALAVDVCRVATRNLCQLPPARRKMPDARTLRQALGYCWSVAVAADPAAGLPAFRELDTEDADVAWIVTQNSRKKRLSSLL
ncbi:MAG: HEAT repeat domain-containing protein [Tessaracoccus sp.]|uniref:HEAT repeat domain-containing protein n=1 Tax=Tessaracoccus sp. TaxID=1971211 RepID=UPI001ECF1AB0|nr:HEAT repeat domain-containing protein [Tessaracoccus sp.]MBK7820616.1 HEAT repeat domain-containing protein [Tessaracoccus sp.]